jgi:thiol-disulfide isomerase/thioredoxin
MRVFAAVAFVLSWAAPVAADVVLLDFYADWCQPCRAMAPVVATIEREGYRVERVNVDQHPQRAAQFGVSAIPTMVATRSGREVGRLAGMVSADDLRRLRGPVSRPAARPAASAPAAVTAPRAAAAKGATARASGGSPGGSANPGLPEIPLALQAPKPASLTSMPSGKAVATATTSSSPLQASVRLVTELGNTRSYGSGSIVSSKPGEALVLTCGHLFSDNPSGRGLIVEWFGDAAPLRMPGELIARDAEADVAVVRIRPTRMLPAASIASRAFKPAAGMPCVAIGCDRGELPGVHPTQVTAVNRYLGPANLECAGVPAQGRSGGGLFAQSGQLVGVCTAADPSEGRGLYAGLAAIHALLDASGLTRLYDAPATRKPDVVLASAATSPHDPVPLPSPQEIGIPLVATARTSAKRAAPSDAIKWSPALQPGVEPQASPAATTTRPTGDAARLADSNSAAEAELVCVIRPISDPTARSKVVMLHRAPAELLQHIAQEQQKQDSRALTGLRVTRPTQRPLLVELAGKNAGLPRPSTNARSGWTPVVGERRAR